MIKINIDKHELEFDKELVDTFEREVRDSFPDSAKVYLTTDFSEKNIDEIFSKYAEQEIKDVIINASKEELALYRGEL